MALGVTKPPPIQANPTQLSLADVLRSECETQDPLKRANVQYFNQLNIPDGTEVVKISTDRRFSDLRPYVDTNASTTGNTKMTKYDIDLSRFPEPIRHNARELHRKHERLWSGHLGNIREAKHYTDLVPGARLFRSQPSRSGPTQRRVRGRINSPHAKGELDKPLENPMGITGAPNS